MKIKKRTRYRTFQSKKRVTKIWKGSKKVIQPKKMRIITEEMTERRTKMKMKSAVAKTRTGKLYDPGQTKF